MHIEGICRSVKVLSPYFRNVLFGTKATKSICFADNFCLTSLLSLIFAVKIS